MGIWDWLKGSKPMEDKKPVVTEKKATVPKKKPEVAKPPTQKMVTNVTKRSEWIGNVEVRPGQSKLIDVGPNTIGETLVNNGTFVIGKPKVRETILQADYLEMSAGTEVVSRETFKCPWCGQNIEGQKEARKHFSLELVKALNNLPE